MIFDNPAIDGTTPLLLAIARGNKELLEVILKGSTKLNSKFDAVQQESKLKNIKPNYIYFFI